MELSQYVVIFVTASSDEEAQRIGRALIEEKLVACSNIASSIRSFYWWKGEICDETEVLLIAKSTQDQLEEIIKKVKELHSYEVPEIIALPILGGSKDYLNWIEEETK